MFVHLENLRDLLFWSSGWLPFVLFLYILDGIVRLFRKDGK